MRQLSLIVGESWNSCCDSILKWLYELLHIIYHSLYFCVLLCQLGVIIFPYLIFFSWQSPRDSRVALRKQRKTATARINQHIHESTSMFSLNVPILVEREAAGTFGDRTQWHGGSRLVDVQTPSENEGTSIWAGMRRAGRRSTRSPVQLSLGGYKSAQRTQLGSGRLPSNRPPVWSSGHAVV